MKPSEVAHQALLSLRANRLRSVLTMLGLVIGVGAVILLIALGEGARRYIAQQVADIGSNLLIVTPGKVETRGGPVFAVGSTYPLTLEDAVTLGRRARDVEGVAPVVLGTSRIKFGGRSRDVPVIGCTESFPRIRNLYVEIGKFIRDDDVEARRRVCVIGRRVRKELFGESNPLGAWVSLGDMKFRVIGIMEGKGVSLGLDIDDIAYIPLRSAQDLFDVDRLFEIIVKARSEGSVEPARAQIGRILTRRHEGHEDFTVTSQNAILSTLMTILATFTWILAGIASISLLVGGVGIMNIMLVSVTERTLEIGLRKAVGARRTDVMRQFITEAVALSLVGGASGILFAGLGALGVRTLVPALPIAVTGWSVVLGFGFSVGVGVFFGVYPAYRASTLNPIDALRHE